MVFANKTGTMLEASELSSVYALNGKVYVGTAGTTPMGLYAIDLKSDYGVRYDNVSTKQSWMNISNRNNLNRTGDEFGKELIPDYSTVLLLHFNNNSAIGENNSLAYDWSGQGNNGTIIGANYTDSGKFGRGMQFDGVNDYVTVSHSASLRITRNITVLTWAKFSASQVNKPLVAKWGADQAYLLLIDPGTANKVGFYIRVSEANKVAVSTATYNDNQWHQYAGVFDGQNVKLYVDGGQETVTGDATTGPIDSPATPLGIGAYNTGNNPFNGTIDEVAIYNRSLSADEIYQHYISGYGRIVGNATLRANTVNDVGALVVDGSTYVAVAADTGVGGGSVGGETLINESKVSSVHFYYNQWAGKHTYSTAFASNGDLYFIYNTQQQYSRILAVYENSSLWSTGTTSGASSASYTYNSPPYYQYAYLTGNPKLYVITNGSIFENSHLLLSANNFKNFVTIDEKKGDESDGCVKYYTSSYITEDMCGDIRGMWPLV
ncbi:hypothetical protein COT48_02495, partial [Candidatus Woesearchaeota archaeon CG08_land_8_20_14_0_20_47_9]